MGDFGPAVTPDETALPTTQKLLSTDVDDIDVLVTGFGPFKTNPINPSNLVAASLPSSINLHSSLDPGADGQPTRRIRIHTYPQIRVSYSAVRSAVPTLIESFKQLHNGKPPDLIVHIGMASTRQHYAVETRAHRDGYTITDVDGRIGSEDGGDNNQWKKEGLPEILSPGLPPPPATIPSSTDTGRIPDAAIISNDLIVPYPPDARFLHTWRSFLSEKHGIDVRLSDDAGRYLCEYIYYTSLAEAYREGRERSVVFLHIPGCTDQASLDNGRDVAIALVKTLVTCWTRKVGYDN